MGFDFQVYLPEREIDKLQNSFTKVVIKHLFVTPNFLPFAAFGCSTEKNESQREKLTLKIRNKKITGSDST